MLHVLHMSLLAKLGIIVKPVSHIRLIFHQKRSDFGTCVATSLLCLPARPVLCMLGSPGPLPWSCVSDGNLTTEAWS